MRKTLIKIGGNWAYLLGACKTKRKANTKKSLPPITYIPMNPTIEELIKLIGVFVLI